MRIDQRRARWPDSKRRRRSRSTLRSRGRHWPTVERLGIDAALTGPFLRGDVGTVRGHLDVIGELAPDAVALYVAVARRELAIARRRGELAEDRAAELERLLDEAGSPGRS